MSETLERFTLVDVFAALHLARDATDNYEKLGRVVEIILDHYENPAGDNRAVDVLLELNRSGDLVFEVGAP